MRGIPPGATDEAGLERLFNACFVALPSFDPAAGAAVEKVQLYSGGTFAFVTLASSRLAATALALPPISLGGETVELSRPREACDAPKLDGAGAADEPGSLPVPPDLDLCSACEAAAASCGSAESSLESKLYWSLRRHTTAPKPHEKEVRESLAFFKKCEKFLSRKALVVDVCGSHGLLAALFVAYGKASAGVVVDKFRPASFDQLLAAWAPFLRRPPPADASGDADAQSAASQLVTFATGDFRDVLPALLRQQPAAKIAVVACHACGHLTDAVVDMCVELGIDFAVMGCCHKDTQTQGQMGLVAKSLGIKEHEAIDVARLGGIVGRGYDCRWRTIDKSITPENRMLIGLARLGPGVALQRAMYEQATEAKMSKVYSRIHGLSKDPYAEGAAKSREGAPGD